MFLVKNFETVSDKPKLPVSPVGVAVAGPLALHDRQYAIGSPCKCGVLCVWYAVPWLKHGASDGTVGYGQAGPVATPLTRRLRG